MKNFYLILILLVASSGSQGQPYFDKYYTQQLGVTFDAWTAGYVSVAKDNSIILVTNKDSWYNTNDTLSVLRIDTAGAVIWRRKIVVPGYASADQIIHFNDSSFAILFQTDYGYYPNYEENLIFKFSLDGNVFWQKGFTSSGVLSLHVLSRGFNGEIILAGGGCGSSRFFVLDSIGNSLNEYYLNYTGILYIDEVLFENNRFTCYGNVNNGEHLIFRLDNNYTQSHFTIINGNFTYVDFINGTKLVQTSDKSYNLIISKGANQLTVCRYDSSLNYKWSKTICYPDTSIAFRSNGLSATKNGNVIVTAYLYKYDSITTNIPVFIEFDSTGAVNFIKCIGNPNSIQNHELSSPLANVLDDNSVLVCYMNKWLMYLWKTNETMNNFCEYSNNLYQFTITDEPLSHNVVSISTSTYSSDSMITENFPVLADTFYENSGCIDLLLSANQTEKQASITIQPNPCSEYFTISSDSKFNTIELFDINGNKIYVSKDSEKTFDAGHLSNGIYIVQIKDDNFIVSYEKLIVIH